MKLPALYEAVDQKTFSTEREILYKILFDMRNDVNELKKLVHSNIYTSDKELHAVPHGMPKVFEDIVPIVQDDRRHDFHEMKDSGIQDTQEITEESLSLADKEIEFIKKAFEKHNGKKKMPQGTWNLRKDFIQKN
jgi:hypothetical protein